MAIFTLQPEEPTKHFKLIVTPDLCVGAPDMLFVFGGTILGAAITAIERCAQRPTIWATAQYLSHAAPGAVVVYEVTLTQVGRYNTQAQATGRAGGRAIVVVSAALGARPQDITAQWVSAPDMLSPEQCPDDFYWPHTAQMLKQKIDIRPALPANADVSYVTPGRMIVWMRAREIIPLDAALLAIMADLATAGIHGALGKHYVGNSLDNTVRICRLVPTRWVLCDIQIDGTHDGFAHGGMRLYAQTGELLAIASQSMILRKADANTT